MDSGAFAIEELREDYRWTLALLGELDVASAPQLRERVLELCGEDTTEVVLDMARLSFIDSSGLNALLRLKEECERRGCAFYLTPGTPPVERLFDITRLRDKLPFRRAARTVESKSA
jgi:anti-sigma B factor antagonist